MTELGIYTTEHKEEEKFLRRKTKPFIISKDGIRHGDKEVTRKELSELVARMRKIMHRANGIGLSANQIGLDFRMFVAQIPSQQGEAKFYAVLNPEIEKYGGEKVTMEEGCLSVLNTYGEVERSNEIVLVGFDKSGKPVKIKAWGLLARVFQHEVDHLDGKLFIDRAKSVHRVEPA